MATGKRYYWIKLKDTFMGSEEVDFLMSQKGGANYIVLYLMLCLNTINTGGKMASAFGECLVPYDVAKIQRDCKWFDIDTIRVALELYKKLGWVYEDEDGILIISKHGELVGSETNWAHEKRSYRASKALADGQCPDNVQDNTVDKTGDIGVDIHGDNRGDNVHPDIRDKRLDIRDTEIRDKSIDTRSRGTTTGACGNEGEDGKANGKVYCKPNSEANVSTDEGTSPANDNLISPLDPSAPRPDFNTIEVYATNNLRVMMEGPLRELAEFKEMLPEELIRHAIDEACAFGKPYWSYVRAILHRYEDEGLKTVADARASDEAFNNRSRNGPSRSSDEGEVKWLV